MRRIRVLILVNRWYSDGGVENFVEQLIEEASDRVDFTIASLITEVDSVAACNKIGPVIVSGKIGDMYVRGGIIENVIKKGHYDVVHIQASNGSAFFIAELARRAGVPRRIIHCHNAGAETSGSFLKKAIGSVSSVAFADSATDLWACSKNAGEYLFGKRKFDTFINGIDIDKYSFSETKRKRIRSELGVSEEIFLLGSIGRISKQKNPVFQVEVFAKVLEKYPNAEFCMIGSGDLEQERNSAVLRLGIDDSVHIVPRTSEADAYYCAFDALLFPPIFEGLSFVGIEAQCCGLPIYASDVVPYELYITDRIHFLPLAMSADKWAEAILESVTTDCSANRSDYSSVLRNAGFDRKECFVNIAESYCAASEYRRGGKC